MVISMTNIKHTKRALLASGLSILACCALLIGSTFAWFTDSAMSGKNKIVAGNLDVELEYTTDFEKWNTVAGETSLFEENTLWEPGHAEVVYLRVRNAGTLALKYRFALDIVAETSARNVYGEEFKLSSYLKFGLVLDQQTAFTGRDAAISAVTEPKTLADHTEPGNLSAGAEKYLALVVYMPKDIGNEANYRGTPAPSIDLGVSVTATQAEEEEDSFGSDYDAQAVFVVGTSDELQEALRVAPTNSVVALKNDIITEVISLWDKNLLLDLRGNTLTTPKIEMYSWFSQEVVNIVIQHGTIQGGNSESDYGLIDAYNDPEGFGLQLTLHDLVISPDDNEKHVFTSSGGLKSSSQLTIDQVTATGQFDIHDINAEITSGTFTARDSDPYLFYCNAGFEVNGGTFTADGADQVIFDVHRNENYDFIINKGDFRYRESSHAVAGNVDISSGYIQINGGNFNGQAYFADMFSQVVAQK